MDIVDVSKLTPMMRQYREIKEQYKDCILLFRLGDFYEMFFEDAITASKALDITLTKRACGENRDAPMCGVPFHAADTYIARLLAKGFKVAVCEQTEDPGAAATLVKREVVSVITPGTVTEDSMLNADDNNYLGAVFGSGDENELGFAWCDVSTGELLASGYSGQESFETMLNEVSRVGVREILIVDDGRDGEEGAEGVSGLEAGLRKNIDIYISKRSIPPVGEANYNSMFSRFGQSAPKALGLEEGSPVYMALAGLFSYLEETQMKRLSHMKPLRMCRSSDSMVLDRASIRNLEIIESLYEREVKGSLLGVLDRTRTAMGSRLLKKWLKEPLIRLESIQERLDAVETLEGDVILRNNIGQYLKDVYDMERLAGRISFGNAGGRDLIALKNSLGLLPDIKAELSAAETGSLLSALADRIDLMEEAYGLISDALTEDPPFSIREGGLIRRGYSEELDNIKDSIKGGQQWIAALEGEERERTGIKNLKVGYNKVFGYYLDVTNSYKGLVPENYIRKQTLVNSERYITPELKEVESRVLGAEARINQMEYDLFSELRLKLQAYIPALQKTADALGALDALYSYAETAAKLGYVKPEAYEGDTIEIVKGRHPVIEQAMKETSFVPNDLYVDRDKRSMLLITGPNMAGKSTYMRQAALIILMAQAGSFVPAESAKIGIADRIYTRIGASDNLAKGESTFFVEMSELAYILNTATDRSFIILDEIGRGTSTYDGLSIAWAVLEFLCKDPHRVRTLFATHYHELTALEGEIPGLINLNTDISGNDDEIVFLHRISEGAAGRSYGIHVAKLAGAPRPLLENAQEKLDFLEKEGRHVSTEYAPLAREAEEKQISFFDFAPNPVIERLKSLNILEITPSQAFSILEELKEAAEK